MFFLRKSPHSLVDVDGSAAGLRGSPTREVSSVVICCSRNLALLQDHVSMSSVTIPFKGTICATAILVQ